MDGEPELALTAETFVPVECVITVEGTDEILGVDRTAEELKSVIRIGEDFDVFDNGSGTNTTHCKAVDLIPVSDGGTTVADRNVLHDTGGVHVVVTPVDSEVGYWQAFDELSSGRAIDSGFTQEDHAAPMS